MKGPLVSAIMPSRNSWSLAERALKSFQAQTYEPKELVVLRPGPNKDEHPAWQGTGFSSDAYVYQRVPLGLSIGELRNVAIRASRGSIIAHWDDDDWSDPRRLEWSVERLRNYDVVGARSCYYHEPATGKAWLYDASDLTIEVKFDENQPFLIGGTLAYRRKLWEFHHFDPWSHVGEDAKWQAALGRMGTRSWEFMPPEWYVAQIHPGNSDPKQTDGHRWKPVELSELPKGAL